MQGLLNAINPPTAKTLLKLSMGLQLPIEAFLTGVRHDKIPRPYEDVSQWLQYPPSETQVG